MKRLAAVLAMLLSLAATPALAGPKVGDVLPDLTVKAQLNPSEAAYLGLPEKTQGVRLSQIKADVLIVEIFSMYCPRCQAEALAVNRMFARLAASPQGARIKFIGIGAGNSPFEVEFFRKKYQIPMPLIPDADYVLHKVFMSVGTPSFFVLKPGRSGLAVLFFHEGVFQDEDAFYEQLLRAATAR
ncbi:MAG: redoxin domain-containing protein [Humidesulfovibrio sp.]|nr:redoxin domain-containing protein [Humidesulfovibrio sp.]